MVKVNSWSKINKELKYGDLFYWKNIPNSKAGICMIIPAGAVSLEDPNYVWKWADELKYIKDQIRSGGIVLAEKGTEVIITQE